MLTKTGKQMCWDFSSNIETEVTMSMVILFYSDEFYPGVSSYGPFELLDIYTDYKDISYPGV